MIERNRKLIERNIQELQSGKQCGLKELFGEDWAKIGTPGECKNFGKLFKKAVKSGEVRGLQWVRIENAGRFDVYEKL